MRSRRIGNRRRALLAVCLVLLLASACKSKPQEPTPLPTVAPTRISQPAATPQRTTVRFALHDVEVPLYEGLIAAFEEENPDLRVQIVSLNEVLGLGPLGTAQMPEDAEQRLVAAADVVTFGVTRQTVRNGLVRDLSPLIETDPRFEAADYIEGALARYQWGGGTWALPTSVHYRLLFYNKDAFDSAGVPYPKPGWTWDEFTLAAARLTERSGDEVTRWGFVCPTGLAYRMIESRAGSLADYDADPSKPRLGEAKVIEALDWYANLHLEAEAVPYSGPPPSDTALALSEEEALIDKDKAAIWPEFAYLLWYRKLQGNVGVVPFPVDSPSSKTTPGWVSTVAMSAGTTRPEAAWRWMVFLTRQEQRGVGQGAQYLPARQSAAQTTGYWDSLDPELADALRWAMTHGYMAPEPVAYDAFQSALHAVLGGEKRATDALAEAQARAEQELQAALLEGASRTPVPGFVVPSDDREAPGAAAAIRISFIPGLGSFNLEPYRRLAERFHEAHPDIAIEVKMLDITGAGGAALSLPGLAKSADCFQWYASLQDPQNLEAILSLEPFLEADPSFDMADYYPQLLAPFRVQGKLWGLPADVTPFVIEYNRDLFDAAGLAYPTPGWTWDEFLAAAVALTQGEGQAKQYGYVAEVYEANDLLLALSRLGASLVDETADPPALTFDDPSVIEAMRWYAALTTDYGVKPAYITNLSKMVGASAFYIEREGLINEGRAAMWTSSGTMAGLFGPREGLDVGVVSLPVRADGSSRTSLLTTSAYFVSARTEHPQACWLWLTFLSGQVEAVQGYPARRSVAESDVYRRSVGEERATAYRASVVDADQSPAFDLLTEEEWLGGAVLWLTQAYGQVLEGQATVEQALDQAQGLADAYRACMVAAGDYSQKTWQGCLRQTDPSLPDFIFAQGG